jgi:hypothetical protein
MASAWLTVVLVVVGLLILSWLVRTLRCLLRAVILLAVLVVAAVVLFQAGVIGSLFGGVP